MNINLNFSKMHGLGNDYVMIDESESEIIPENKKSEVAKELCTRGFSVGADGVIFVNPSNKKNADIRFRIFNADGSEAEMCGNGIRCFAKYVFEKNIIHSPKMLVETMEDIKELSLKVDNKEVTSIRVDMGLSTFNPPEIPMKTDEEEFIDKEIIVDRNPVKITVLSVGNPHAVTFTDDLDTIVLEKIGPLIEYHELFPERINAHFIRIMSRGEVEMITWERGSGVTLACGTGATSSVIAGYRLGLLDEDVQVHLPGGELNITIYQEDNQLGAFMEGSATKVFEGTMELNI
ncbi:MAG: diaminopimelate epimerase [Methanobacterium sp.]|nr:diaminopimelate epimerase [Methanobacterium sp.]